MIAWTVLLRAIDPKYKLDLALTCRIQIAIWWSWLQKGKISFHYSLFWLFGDVTESNNFTGSNLNTVNLDLSPNLNWLDPWFGFDILKIKWSCLLSGILIRNPVVQFGFWSSFYGTFRWNTRRVMWMAFFGWIDITRFSINLLVYLNFYR